MRGRTQAVLFIIIINNKFIWIVLVFICIFGETKKQIVMKTATELKNGQTFTNGSTPVKYKMIDIDSLLVENLNTGKKIKLKQDCHVYEISNSESVKDAKKSTPRNLNEGDRVEFDYSYLGLGKEIKTVHKIEATKSGKRFNVVFTDGSTQQSNGPIGYDTTVA